MPDYTSKVDALLAHCSGFDASDFVELAIAALDQAGLSGRDQSRVRALIDYSDAAERIARKRDAAYLEAVNAHRTHNPRCLSPFDDGHLTCPVVGGRLP